MENYMKDAVIELDIDCLPFDNNCDKNVIHMKVKNGTKIKNIIEYSMKHFIDNQNEKQIVVSGSANGSQKAISCAEILKRKYVNKWKSHLYQMTKIDYKSIEEYWKPIDNNLDVLKVIRKIPTIYILLSKQPLNPSEAGYQYMESIQTNHFIKDNKQEFNRNKRSFKSKQKNSGSKTNTKATNEEVVKVK